MVLVANLNARSQVVSKDVVPHRHMMPPINPYSAVPIFFCGGVQIVGEHLVSLDQNVYAVLNQNAPTDIVVGLVVPNDTIGTHINIDAGTH